MNIRYQQIIAVVAGAIMIGGFQNCAKTNFGAPPGSVMNASVNGDGSTGGATGNLVQNGDTCTVSDGDQTQTGTSAHYASLSCHSGTSMGETSTGQSSPNECDSDSDESLVVCILDGPGKSVKLGLVNGALAGVNDVSQAVCMSKSECLGDVAKSFGVKGAYQRGYCEGNPNVMDLTDAQVKKLLGL